MSRFSSLLEPRNDISVAQQQRRARENLSSLLRQSRLRLWQPGDPIPERGHRVLVGMASYSASDLALLDTINEALDQGTNLPRLDVFNVLDCEAAEDLEKYVPGIGKVFQTPVVEYWEDGFLKDRAWGKAGRDLLAKVLGLSF